MHTINTQVQLLPMDSSEHSQSQDLSSPNPKRRFGIKSTNVIIENFPEPIEAVVLIEDEKIFDIITGEDLNPDNLSALQATWNIIDYQDKFIFPGLVDSNVHLHANFGTEWENITYCTELAAAGGVTTIVDNPVMSRPYSNGDEYVKSMEQRITAIEKNSKVDFGVFGILEPKTQNSIGKLNELGVLGLKGYLLNTFQSSIGHFPPEEFKNVLDEIESKYPNLLLAIHPEIATEREIYLTSPCRTVTLDKRLDREFGIKSLEFGGAANKGSYYEETGKKSDNDAINNECLDDDYVPGNFIDTPSKLESRINKSKQKTEVQNLVHFELASYAYGKKITDAEESDSDPEDFLSSLKQKHKSQSPVRPRLFSGDHAKSILNHNRRDLFGRAKEDSGSAALADVKDQTQTKYSTKKALTATSPLIESKLTNTRGSANDKKMTSKEGSIELGLRRNTLREIPEELIKEDKQICNDILSVEEKKDLDDFLKVKGPQELQLIKEKDPQILRGEMEVDLIKRSPEKKSSFAGGRKRFVAVDDCDDFTSAVNKDDSQESQEGQKTALSTNVSSTVSCQKFSIQSDLRDHTSINNQDEETHQIRGLVSEEENEQVQARTAQVQQERSQVRKFLSLHIGQSLMTASEPKAMTEIPRIYLGVKSETEDVKQEISPFTAESNDQAQMSANSNISSSSPCISPSKALAGSSLLQRRISGKSSSSGTWISTKSTIASPCSNFSRVNSLNVSDVAKSLALKEEKYNGSYRIFLGNRPVSWEENAVSMLLNCMRPDSKVKILIQNLSLATSILKIRKKRKINDAFLENVICDSSPSYLYFNESMVKKGETKYKVSPPFRDEENQQNLIDSFKLGGIDVMSSYHFFVPPRYKLVDNGNFRRAFGGLDSMGCSLQALWTTLYYDQQNATSIIESEEKSHIKTGINDLIMQIARTMATNPAKMLGISDRKGSIAKGKDADFVIWDPYQSDENTWLSPNHVYLGRELMGVVLKTYLRGNLIYSKEVDSKISSNYSAKFIKN